MKTETKERGIIMNAEMVRATLARRKTQTRRTSKLDPINNDDQGRTFVYQNGKVWAHCKPNELNDDFPPKTIYGGEVDFIDGKWYTPIEVGKGRPLTCPYGRVGDVLYVRETWMPYREESEDDVTEYIRYKADHQFVVAKECKASEEFFAVDPWKHFNEPEKWRVSIHMPKWASRIKLRITDVRLERINEISEDDAIAEGITATCQQCGLKSGFGPCSCGRLGPEINYVADFKTLWESIHGPQSFDDRWTWVVCFQRIEQ